MDLKVLWKKLFSNYLVLGLINILMALVFVYNSSTTIIKERAINQLFAVSAFAEHELQSYFENLKVHCVQNTKFLTSTSPIERFSSSLISVSIISNQVEKALFGASLEKPVSYFNAQKPLTFYSLGKEHFSIIVPYGKEKVIYVFAYEGFIDILSQREGMGETGEVYLVGEDNHIKGGSRHIVDLESTTVNNKAVQKARTHGRGTEMVKDYRGKKVLSAYSNFKVDELKFVLLSEIDKDEVFAPLNKALPRVLLLCLLFLVVTVFVAVLTTRKMFKFFHKMKKQLNEFNLNIINTVEEESSKLSGTLSQLIQDLKNEDSSAMVIEKLMQIKASLQSDELMTQVNLLDAIQNLIKKTGELNKVETTIWINQRLNEIKFPSLIRMNIFRIVQEIVSQMVQLKASQLSMIITKQDSLIVLRMEGTSSEKINPLTFTQLLLYRIELLDGEIVHTIDKHSLVITIQFPISFARSSDENQRYSDAGTQNDLT